jgi:hypothetical protein
MNPPASAALGAEAGNLKMPQRSGTGAVPGRKAMGRVVQAARYVAAPKINILPNTQGSLGELLPWQSHTERKVRRPGALSEAGSRGTPQITGVACGAETRHSEEGPTPEVYPVMLAPPGEARFK